MRQLTKAELNPVDFDAISISHRMRAKAPAAGHFQFPNPLIKGRIEAYMCFKCYRNPEIPVGKVKAYWDSGTIELVDIFLPEVNDGDDRFHAV